MVGQKRSLMGLLVNDGENLKEMVMNIGKQIAALKRMTVTELRRKHIEAFGEPAHSGNNDYLVKRIAWRLQAQAYGGLSERARRRAEELANEADLRSTAPMATGR